MKNKKAIMLTDILAFLLNDILGWFIIIWFDSTGNAGKFPNEKLHWGILVIGLIHIVISLICSALFYKKERTGFHIQIGKGLLIYNIIMTLIPYLYLLIILLV